jgi:crotonobetainyl-CoA:carnitine CoA-transferase CaiB-like acyl-CoA transferase
MMPVLPNIYVDGNRSKRGLVLDLKDAGDQARLRDLVAASDVVVENAMAGVWERLGLDQAGLREVNPNLIYARAKGFGIQGPLAGRPSFDYVVQAATGMEMTQGGSAGPRPGNVVVNDYGTGLLLAAGVVCALLGRARGVAVTTVDASLAMTASLYQAGDVATLAVHGALEDQVGDEARGPSVGRRLYRTKDGWVTVFCATDAQVRRLGVVTGAHTAADDDRPADVVATFEVLTTDDVLSRLHQAGVPAAPSVHHSAVPDDPQVVARGLLCHYEHPAAGRFVQVGIPLSLSVDTPAVRGPAPTPAPVRRRKRRPS